MRTALGLIHTEIPMSVEKVVIGASGEVILPSQIRSALHLKVGSELWIENTPAGVLLKPEWHVPDLQGGGGRTAQDLPGA